MTKGQKIKVFYTEDDISVVFDQNGNKLPSPWSSEDIFSSEVDGDFKKYERRVRTDDR
jgi:hypothetical protein